MILYNWASASGIKLAENTITHTLAENISTPNTKRIGGKT
jgi:hypothetical protein